MAMLIILKGPSAGHLFPLPEDRAVIGRAASAAVCLPFQTVSRRHAAIVCRDGVYCLEDLGSANGTYLNGERLTGSKPLEHGNTVQIGEHVLVFQAGITPPVADPDLNDAVPSHILERVEAAVSNAALYEENPAENLQLILELARHLGQTLELQPLLDRLLQYLLQLFPLADRGLVVLCEQGQLVVRAQRSRHREEDFPFSRAIIQQALAAGAGILSGDPRGDGRFARSGSLLDVDATSLMCVPLVVHEGQPLGAIQLDCTRPTQAFQGEHLRLLTTVSLLVAVVLDNVALNAVRVREETLRRDLALAREIQLGFLPTDFTPPPGSNCEVYARVYPAREVSGDLYDFFPLGDGRLAFLVGDVSGKGIPASLFMVKVQTLARHLAALTGGSASETLGRLNDALTVNNPSCMFVTLVHGIYDPRTGEVVLASAGHPRPLLRRGDGQVEEVAMPVGRLLGCFDGPTGASDVRWVLDRGETLILYSDGYTEATAPDGKQMLGLGPLREILGGPQTSLPLAACAEKARLVVEQFTGSTDPQDDLTLLLLRRT
jgi:serine phosphatase RsbU (regulator of sigma subunit)/pSer/pThr/pTyr-binding forkhead associated (FHA) protein